METKYVVTKVDKNVVTLESPGQVLQCLCSEVLNSKNEREARVVSVNIKDEALVIKFDEEAVMGDLEVDNVFLIVLPIPVGAVIIDYGDCIIVPGVHSWE